MGLNYIIENASVYLVKKGELDGWGISKPSGEKVLLRCFLRGAEDSTPMESQGGKQVIPSYSVSFNGDVPFGAGDILEVEGKQFEVLRKKPTRGLSREVMFTKVTL